MLGGFAALCEVEVYGCLEVKVEPVSSLEPKRESKLELESMLEFEL